MHRPRLFVLIVFGGLFAWLFADALVGSGVFAFRDAGHYYYPLFEFVRSEWWAGRIPLWNPYENLGMPVAASGTASVFYPGTLIFLVPIEFAWSYNLYILGHLILAAGTTYRLARHWRSSVEAAGVAALSYAFCGNVLFGYCNVIFLVGAAWLPLAIEATDRMLVGRSFRAAIALGIVLALTVLGGNAEMAYHIGLLATTYAVWLGWCDRSNKASGEKVAVRKWRPLLLATAAITGLILAAVQVFPSIEFTKQSGRASTEIARNVYELPTRRNGSTRNTESEINWYDGLTCRHIEPGTHHEHIYHFSVGPWRVVEYLWPNVGGRQFPTHRRWIKQLTAEGRFWVPSLYMGLIPLVLALASMRFRHDTPRETWLTWSVVFTLVGSFGWYGLGWLWLELRYLVTGNPDASCLVGEPFGGIYWLMTLVMPGSIYFRYPAKLLVIAALGLSLLSAAGWDRAISGRADRLRRVLLGLTVLSLVGAITSLAIRFYWDDWLASVPPDPLFGPLDTFAASNDLLRAFVQTAVVAILFFWLLGKSQKSSQWPAMMGLVLVAIDLAVANSWMIVCAPAQLWQAAPAVALAIEEAETHYRSDQPYRISRRGFWLPPKWRSVGSSDRMQHSAGWDRNTLFPKHNLSVRLSLDEVSGTMRLSDFDQFMETHRGLMSKYVLLPGGMKLPGGERLEIHHPPEDVSLWYNPRHALRAWIDHSDRRSIPLTAAEQTIDGESCRVTLHTPQRVEIEATLLQPGIVVLFDQYYPGWQLEVETVGQGIRSVPILRVHQAIRGVRLEPGQHRLVYRYRPTSVIRGAWISGLGWLFLAVGLYFNRKRA